jgi:hypothetical protein
MGARLFDRLVRDAGIEPMLTSWIVIDNHDIPRIATLVPDLAMRKENRALRVGDYRLIESEHLFAFERHTDRALETIIVVANPSDREITEQLMIANPGLMADTLMVDALNRSSEPAGKASSGFLKVVAPPMTALVLKPKESDLGVTAGTSVWTGVED